MLAIVAFCSSSRPGELRGMRIGALRKDKNDLGIWISKFHGKNKGGKKSAVCL